MYAKLKHFLFGSLPNDATKYLDGTGAFSVPAGTGTVTNTGTLTANQLIKGNGGVDITVGNLSGDVTTSGSMATTIANSAVTLAKIANAAANSKLLGSGSAGSGSAYSELTLGSNLSMSGTTLNATGGGGGAAEFFIGRPAMAEAPTSNFATYDTRNSHPVLDFDDTTSEATVFSSQLPASYAGGGLTVTIMWSATSATSGTVIWNAAIERDDEAGIDIDSDSFAAAQAVTATAPGTNGQIDYATITFTDGAQMDSLAAGEMFRIKISRDIADTMTGDAELLLFIMKET